MKIPKLPQNDIKAQKITNWLILFISKIQFLVDLFSMLAAILRYKYGLKCISKVEAQREHKCREKEK